MNERWQNCVLNFLLYWDVYKIWYLSFQPLQYLYTFPLSKSPDTQYGAYLADASHIMLAVALYKLGQYDRCVEVLKANKCETFALTAVYIQGKRLAESLLLSVQIKCQFSCDWPKEFVM